MKFMLPIILNTHQTGLNRPKVVQKLFLHSLRVEELLYHITEAMIDAIAPSLVIKHILFPENWNQLLEKGSFSHEPVNRIEAKDRLILNILSFDEV